MCRVGEFNQSQASMTSPAALAALRDLPQTQPDLHLELTSNLVVQEPTDGVDEPAFSNEVEDASDIPLQTAISHVMSENADLEDGFIVQEDGSLSRASVLEDPDHIDEASLIPAALEAPSPILGRGQRNRSAPKLFGGAGAWES